MAVPAAATTSPTEAIKKLRKTLPAPSGAVPTGGRVGKAGLISAPLPVQPLLSPSSVSLHAGQLSGLSLEAAGVTLSTTSPSTGPVPVAVRDSLPAGSTAPAAATAAALLQLRHVRLLGLLSQHRSQVEVDDAGQPVRRGVVIALDPRSSDLDKAARAGFRLLLNEPDAELGMRVVHMAVPPGLTAPQALRRLKQVAPAMQADYNHLFEPAGGALLAVGGALAAGRVKSGVRIGMVDGGVASHASLAAAAIKQRGFSGKPHSTGHGTAVASLIVGNQGAFRGAARDASLLVADVYGGNPAAGSATTVVRALSWLASERAKVINVSLVGPPNKILARAVESVRARGIHVVAAVGNDGPAAPPRYPASYPGVVAVTGVDSAGQALREAGRASHLDFAAPGADMAAALPGRGYVRVRGTSYASPLAAARLAAAGSPLQLAAEARPGTGPVGRGIVCGTCPVRPSAVNAK